MSESIDESGAPPIPETEPKPEPAQKPADRAAPQPDKTGGKSAGR